MVASRQKNRHVKISQLRIYFCLIFLQAVLFSEDMGLRDDDIQHVFEDVIKIHNETWS